MTDTTAQNRQAQTIERVRPTIPAATSERTTPDAMMKLGLAFWGSKALLSAVELGLFTRLAHGPLTGETLTAKLGLQPRGTTDWLDALVPSAYSNAMAYCDLGDRLLPRRAGVGRRPLPHPG